MLQLTKSINQQLEAFTCKLIYISCYYHYEYNDIPLIQALVLKSWSFKEILEMLISFIKWQAGQLICIKIVQSQSFQHSRECFKVNFLKYIYLITNVVEYCQFIVKAFIYTTIFLLLCIYFSYIYNFLAIASCSSRAVLLVHKLFVKLLRYYYRLRRNRQCKGKGIYGLRCSS